MQSKMALIIVDMLKSFFQPTEKLPVSEYLLKVAENIKILVDECRKRGIPVIYANDAFLPAEVPIDHHFKLHGVHAVKGTPGAEVYDLIAPTEKDFVIEKKLYDGFYNTRLDSVLRELKVDTVMVTGTWTNCCVMHTVMGAWERLYQPIVPEDTVTCPDESEHQHALRYMEKYYGAKIVNLSESLDMIKKTGVKP